MPRHGPTVGSIDYKTSTIKDEDPLRELLFYQDLDFSHTLRILPDRRRKCELQSAFDRPLSIEEEPLKKSFRLSLQTL